MRTFTFSEIWGMAPCHICGKDDYITQLSDDEEKQIKGMDGAEAATFICKNKLGKPVCDKHANFEHLTQIKKHKGGDAQCPVSHPLRK